MTMMRWEFDVDVSTHNLLRRGVVVADRRRVVLLLSDGDDYLVASLVAYALACVDGVQVTNLWLRL